MDVDEYLWWVIRIAVILMVGVTIMILLALLVPDLKADQLRADVLAGRIAYSGGFSSEPGRIDISKFTQEIADQAVVYDDGAQTTIHTKIGARVTLVDPNLNVIAGPIYYNKPGWDSTLSAYGRVLPGENIDIRRLPVTIDDDSPRDAILQIEVLYAQ